MLHWVQIACHGALQIYILFAQKIGIHLDLSKLSVCISDELILKPMGEGVLKIRSAFDAGLFC